MCIKVNEDDALRSQNQERADAAHPCAGDSWKATVERSRAAAGAAAALVSAGTDGAPIVAGALPSAAQGLGRAIAAIVPRGDACRGGHVVLRKSWGVTVCPDVLELQHRFGLDDLSLLEWFEGPAWGWIALVNLAHEGPRRVDCGQLRSVAEVLRERCILQAQMHEATLLTQRLQDVARSSGDWSWETDEHHRYTWVHGTLPTASAHTVRAPAVGELIPSGLVVNWQGEPESPLRDLHAVLRQGEPFVRLATREYAYGRSRYVLRSAVPLLHPDGSLRGFRGSARDVTQSLEAKAQLWRRDKALRLAKEQAEASSQAKSMLVSKMGHELRTPLNAIVGLAQLIQTRSDDDGGGAAVERWVAQIAKTGWHMVDMLDLLMELGRAGAVQASPSSKPVDLVEVVREATQLVERDAQARAISISLEGDASVPARVDRRALCQIVVNLLSNAIKYNREGGWVRVGVMQDEHTRIEIHDTGRGLTQDQVSRLFRPFERLGAEASDVAGHGLGLLICKELVAAMQGRLDVRSTVGQGTTFTVLLPAEPMLDADISPERVARGCGSGARAS
jgi:signal transduction histidine kinase